MSDDDDSAGAAADDGGDGAMLGRLRDAVEKRDVAAIKAVLVDLYQHWWPRLVCFAQGRGGDEASAEDAVQIGWSKAMQKILESILLEEPPPQFTKAWFYTIVRNKIIDKLRHDQRDPVVPVPSDEGNGLENMGKVSDPAEDQLQREDISVIRKGLEILDPKRTVYLLLQHYEEMTVSEIAEVTEESQTTVKGRLKMAHDHLYEIVLTLKKLEGALWASKEKTEKLPRPSQERLLSSLSKEHVDAWELFFVKSTSAKDIASKLKMQRPAIIKILREAFAHLEKNCSTLELLK
jgi:RNA polymerase sigma factor (sigma-70 family)